MNTFVINQCPFQRGLRPRGFFAERKRMIQSSAQGNNGGLSYNSSWQDGKSGNHFNDSNINQSKKAFFETTSWTLSLSLTAFNTLSILT